MTMISTSRKELSAAESTTSTLPDFQPNIIADCRDTQRISSMLHLPVVNNDGASSSIDDDENGSLTSEVERDEVVEIQKLASKDTNRVRLLRTIVTVLLFLTGLAVTLTTNRLLRGQESGNFETAFQKFARTVGDAAKEQQQDIREAYKSLADTLSTSARAAGAVWPFYSLPSFETYAKHMLLQSSTEIIAVDNKIRRDQMEDWIAYADANYKQWINESHSIADSFSRFQPTGYKQYVARLGSDGWEPDLDDREHYYIEWSFSPAPASYSLVNWNLASVPDYGAIMEAIETLGNQTLVTRVRPYAGAVGVAFAESEHDALHSALPEGETEHPHSIFFHPVHRDANDATSDIVAILAGGSAWDAALRNLLPEGVNGITIVVNNNCNQSYTYMIEGPEAVFIGSGDFHDPKYDYMQERVDLSPHSHSDFESTPGHCIYHLNLYPSDSFESIYHTATPLLYSVVTGFTFILVGIAFVLYDALVQNRNTKLISSAARSNAIVTQLFPGNIRDKLLNQSSGKSSQNLISFLQGEDDIQSGAQPLADLFLDTSIIFADVSGFTAWSSTREPYQVFTLLETIYAAFDAIAKRHKIYKVETVGDCYVAASGIPHPRKDHATLMALFARDLMRSIRVVTKKLEISLGPDTSELDLRIGIHSGPVTAGVLRGDRARFQLFGDTMNTTSRMESTSKVGKIQVSQEFAEALAKNGKAHWVKPRENAVDAKGLGVLKTYWLNMSSVAAGETPYSGRDDSRSSDAFTEQDRFSEKENRLVDWTVETLTLSLTKVVGGRTSNVQSTGLKLHAGQMGTQFLNEVQEVVIMPDFEDGPDAAEITALPVQATNELRSYVALIADTYRQNHFHNFEHASHVLMSVTKLMARIVAPSSTDAAMTNEKTESSSLHDHTYGITSDPLTQFACAFAALIHDVDHAGVPNSQLVKEQAPVATLYGSRSVAEQNSLELAWNLLMEDSFSNLRAAIAGSMDELRRFRQLLVNAVMATDIVDKDLKNLRNGRWDKAFKVTQEQHQPGMMMPDSKRDVSRKATIVIEHIIQASDVAHTMQHWHIYRKWNERFFLECHQAFRDGRADHDPSDNWYKGEIGFFDFYIIPLAKKLKECGVFGVSSDEYLNYALKNRAEWVVKGEKIVAGLRAKVMENDATEEASLYSL